MKYLMNPVTQEVRYATSLEAKRLARYAWTYVDKQTWVDYQRAQVQLSMARHINAAKPRLGLVH